MREAAHTKASRLAQHHAHRVLEATETNLNFRREASLHVCTQGSQPVVDKNTDYSSTLVRVKTAPKAVREARNFTQISHDMAEDISP